MTNSQKGILKAIIVLQAVLIEDGVTPEEMSTEMDVIINETAKGSALHENA